MTCEEIRSIAQFAATREQKLWQQAMHDHIAAFRRALDEYDVETQKQLMPLIMARLDTCKMVERRVDMMRLEAKAEAYDEMMAEEEAR